MWNLFKRTPKREPRTEKISEDTEVTFIPLGDGECVLPVIHPAGMVFPANPPKPCPHGAPYCPVTKYDCTKERCRFYPKEA